MCVHACVCACVHASIQPSFSQEQAEEYFSRVYSATPKTFSHPEWMPECMTTVICAHDHFSLYGGGSQWGHIWAHVLICPQPCQPDNLHRHQEVPLPFACTAAHVQLLLDHPGHPHSMEGWHSAPVGREEGS